MSAAMLGLLGIICLLLLIAVGMPFGFAFLLVGFLGSWYLSGFSAGLSIFSIMPYTWASDYSLMAIPLFVLMGFFAESSGISRDLFDAGYKWLGRLPGGLAAAAVFACTGFAACSGSSVATAATIGTVSWPEMKKHGYSARLGLGAIAAAGGIGIMIPPSTGFIVYGMITEQSIGKLFMAGILPGLLQASCLIAMVVWRVKRNPDLAPPSPSFSWGERLVALRNVWGMMLLFILILGGIYFGVFTPTEAAGVGAFGAFVLALVRRGLKRQNIASAMLETGRITVMVFVIIIGVMTFSSFIAATQVSRRLVEIVGTAALPPYVIIVLAIALYVLLGMFVDAIGMMALTLPFVYPIVTGLGFDPIWFGVLMVMVMEIGVITPPLGMNVFVLKGVAKDVPMEEIFKGIAPFLLADLVVVAILIAFPQISLFLPGLMGR
ncbi:MAG: TRAP transporter large permease [Chloroflexi bacterium]|nr:TRAP transporter large permease [Chloroflexota bacterium]